MICERSHAAIGQFIMATPTMSYVGKSVKSNINTKTRGGKTISTTVNVEDTFEYSDGRTETQTRTKIFEGPPPSEEQINAFIDSGEPDVANNTGSSSDSSQKIQPTQPSVPPDECAKQAVEAHNEPTMSYVGKSVKSNINTKTRGGKTISTTVNVEDTFEYSDGRTETQTRTKIFEGPPPSEEQINAFIDSGEPDVANNTGSSSDSSQKIQPTQPSVPPDECAKQAVEAHNEPTMSYVGKSVKSNINTKTRGGKTISTTVNVEDTFEYSDGRTETQTRTKIFEGPPPSEEQINAFIDSGEPDVVNNTGSSSDSSQKIQPTQPSVPPGEYAKQAVEAHNEVRAKHGVSPLTVASDLCALAQKWADDLLANKKFEHSQQPGIGENLAMNSGSPDYAAKEVTKKWYGEIDAYQPYFGKEPPPMGSGPAYGHFTQVVWKDTKEMGIGKAKGEGRVIVVANYRPAGNFIGSYSQNVFPLK